MVIITTNIVPWQVNEPNVKEIEKDLDENFGSVLRSHKKKGENVMVGEVDEILKMGTLQNKMFFKV